MGYPTEEIDDSVAKKAATLLAAADREAGGDSGVEVNDAYNAAIAYFYGEPVLTENVTDCEQLGVDVETY